jgi:hypothetical protein
MKKILFLTVIAAGFGLLQSCERETPTIPYDKNNNTADTIAKLSLKFNPVFGGQALTFGGMDFTKPDGEKMQFDQFKILLSDFQLIRPDNSKVKLGDGFVYADFKARVITTPHVNMPAGDYKGVSFVIGLDSATNHGDPAVWPAEHPLNPIHNGLHWGWAGGYIFSMLDGNYVPAAGGNSRAFSFHMATMRYIRRYTLDGNFTITKRKHTLNVQVDALEYFKNPHAISFVRDGGMSHSTGSEIGLMDRIFTNMEDFATLKNLE